MLRRRAPHAADIETGRTARARRQPRGKPSRRNRCGKIDARQNTIPKTPTAARVTRSGCRNAFKRPGSESARHQGRRPTGNGQAAWAAGASAFALRPRRAGAAATGAAASAFGVRPRRAGAATTAAASSTFALRPRRAGVAATGAAASAFGLRPRRAGAATTAAASSTFAVPPRRAVKATTR